MIIKKLLILINLKNAKIHSPTILQSRPQRSLKQPSHNYHQLLLTKLIELGHKTTLNRIENTR